MNTALITGITGFCGSHLAEALLAKGCNVIGTKRHRSNIENIKHIADKIIVVDNVDLCDPISLIQMLNKYIPDTIFHLAAQSYVHQSWDSYSATIDANIGGTYNLLNAIRFAGYKKYPTVLLAGSSEEYGNSPDACKLTEESKCVPVSPYGVSKLAATMAGVQNFHSYGIPTIMSRAFNHTGARRGSAFLISNFAKQIVEMEKGLREPILRHGDCSTSRDYTDVKDTVRAYILAVENCEAGEIYNISSGNYYTGYELLTFLKSAAKIRFETEIDKERFRPSDIPILHSASNKFHQRTSWKSTIHIGETINDIMEYWRNQI